MLRVSLVILFATGLSAQPCIRGYEAGVPLKIEAKVFGAGDLNEDGRPDLASLTVHGALAAHMNRGGDVYQRIALFNVEAGPVPELYVVDVDGDRNLDILVRNFNRLATVRGRGDGTFADPVLSTVRDANARWRMADLNGDGRPDFLAVGNNRMETAVATADGTFVAGSTIAGVDSVWETSPWALADFDGDGDTDAMLVYDDRVGRRQALQFAWNEGDLRFTIQPSTPIPHAHTGFAITATDVDGDGLMEVVGRGEGGMLVIRAPGRKVSSEIVPVIGELGEMSPRGVGDLDADGRPDIVLADTGGIAVAWGREDAAAPFQAAAWELSHLPLVIADINGDGASDISGMASDGYVMALHGVRGARTLRGSPLTPVWPRIGSAMAVDVDGDGRRDVAGQEVDDEIVALFASRGDGRFTPKTRVPDATIRAAGDFDGDGNSDLAVLTGTAFDRPLALVFGDGAWNFPARLETGLVGPRQVHAATIGGRTSLIVSMPGAVHALTVSSGRNVTVTPIASVAANVVTRVTDVDGDGDSDLIIGPNTFTGFHPLTVWRQTAAGWQEQPLAYSATSDALLTGADLNGDGRQDLILHDSSDYAIGLGQGDGTFRWASGLSGWLLAIVDMDRDGLLDFVARESSWLVVHRTNANATPEPSSLTRSAAGYPLFVEDVDGDGWSDVTATGGLSGIVTLRNVCAAPFARAAVVPDVVRDGEPAAVVIERVGVTGGRTTVRLGSTILASGSSLSRVAVPHLPPGVYTFNVEVQDDQSGIAKTTATLRVLSGQKRRAVR